MDKFKNCEHAARMRVGSEEGAEAFVYLAGLEYTRQVFVRYADAGVGLSVLEKDVIAGIVFFDKTVLEQQCVLFRVDHRVAYVLNLGHQHLRLIPIHLFMEVA